VDPAVDQEQGQVRDGAVSGRRALYLRRQRRAAQGAADAERAGPAEELPA